jgi:cell division protein FtsB
MNCPSTEWQIPQSKEDHEFHLKLVPVIERLWAEGKLKLLSFLLAATLEFLRQGYGVLESPLATPAPVYTCFGL